MELRITINMRKSLKTYPRYMFWKKPKFEHSSMESLLTVPDDEISIIEPYFDESDIDGKKRSLVTLRSNKEFIVNSPYEELTKHKQTKVIRGFYGN